MNTRAIALLEAGVSRATVSRVINGLPLVKGKRLRNAFARCWSESLSFPTLLRRHYGTVEARPTWIDHSGHQQPLLFRVSDGV